jgi:hypothetical protein
MKNKLDQVLNVIIALILVAFVFEVSYFLTHWRGSDKIIEPIIIDPIQPILLREEPIVEEVDTVEELVIPESMNLDIPFITQAPFRSWKEYPFNHTCEEATVLQVHYYFSKETIEENKIKQDLLDMVDFETKEYGFHEDTSAAQTAKLIEDYYGYKTETRYDISLEDIKKEIANGHPVIVPTAGRLLNNPHFTPPGPLYHMIVIKGYTPTEFITNDPGTYKTGADWPYSYQVLEQAIRDWNNGDVLNGRSAMISVWK